jgi:type II secretory pathway pseudopilin PulG
MKTQKGFTIVEVLISAVMVGFLLFGALYVVGNILTGSALSEKRVELTDELDTRINAFVLNGTFDESPSGDMTFSEGVNTNNVLEFTGTNANYNLTITKSTFDIGNGNSKDVVLCHKPGTPAEMTKTIPSPALKGHLGHGDNFGPCAEKTNGNSA